jgi:hypothetical protein
MEEGVKLLAFSCVPVDIEKIPGIELLDCESLDFRSVKFVLKRKVGWWGWHWLHPRELLKTE